MKQTVITGCAVLVALAFLVVPALAAPSSLHKVTWKASAVSVDNPLSDNEIVGAQMKFEGAAVQGRDGWWSGTGTIVDKRGRFRANLVINDVYYLSDNRVQISGEEATVIANGVTYHCPSFGLTFDRSSSDCSLYVEQSLESAWVWWISGSSFKGNVKIT